MWLWIWSQPCLEKKHHLCFKLTEHCAAAASFPNSSPLLIPPGLCVHVCVRVCLCVTGEVFLSVIFLVSCRMILIFMAFTDKQNLMNAAFSDFRRRPRAKLAAFNSAAIFAIGYSSAAGFEQVIWFVFLSIWCYWGCVLFTQSSDLCGWHTEPHHTSKVSNSCSLEKPYEQMFVVIVQTNGISVYIYTYI